MRICTFLFVLMAEFLFPANPADAQPVAGAASALNGLRAEQGLGALTASDKLQQMADLHAQDMTRRGYFSHTGPDGSDIAERARAVGFSYCALAENIASGQESLDAVMSDWAASAGHRRNMLNPDVQVFGLARSRGNVWVMVLGLEGC